jgi:hypothetical protein
MKLKMGLNRLLQPIRNIIKEDGYGRLFQIIGLWLAVALNIIAVIIRLYIAHKN